MKKINVLLACLFLLVPFLGSAQKDIIVLDTDIRTGGGGDRDLFLPPNILIELDVYVRLNPNSRSSGEFIFPTEGQDEAVPTYLVLQKVETGEIVHSTLLNGLTFHPTPFSPVPGLFGPPHATDCPALFRKIDVDFLTDDDCSFPMPADGVMDPEDYRLGLFNADSYDEATNLFMPTTTYIRALIGYGHENVNQCITYEGEENFTIQIDCNGQTLDEGVGFVSNDGNGISNQRITVEDETKDKLIPTVSPNPFSDNIEIANLTNNEITTIKIFDSKGNLISFVSEISSKRRISTSGWAAGFYILKVETASETKTFKLLKF